MRDWKDVVSVIAILCALILLLRVVYGVDALERRPIYNIQCPHDSCPPCPPQNLRVEP